MITASSFAGDCFANDFPVSGGAAPRISPDCRRSAGQSLNEKGNKSPNADQHHDRAPMRVPIRKDRVGSPFASFCWEFTISKISSGKNSMKKPISGKKNTPINSIVCTSLQSHYSTVRPSVDEAKQGKCDFLPFPQIPQRENVSKAAPLVDFSRAGCILRENSLHFCPENAILYEYKAVNFDADRRNAE